VNEFGFIETPYRKVDDGKVSEERRVLLGAPGGGPLHRAGERRVDKKGKFSGD
jgi:hypothetical protein